MIDLHCHTTYSDGSKTIEEVIALAKKLKLKQLAITDHNTLAGSIVAHQYEPELVLTGTELSVGYKGNELHLLGYFPKPSNFSNVNFVIKQGELNKSIALVQMIENLNAEGYDITMHELSKYGSGTINRVHICRALMEHGYIKSVAEGFDNVIGNNSKAYVKREYVPIDEAVKAIHDDGGIAVIAHPYNYKMQDNEVIEMLDYVVNLVDGIECYHPSADINKQVFLKEYASKRNKRITGGSDYHGDNKPNISLGMMNVDDIHRID